MNKTIGKVIDIYIPEQYKNNALLDIMDRNNITFKILTNNGLKEITAQQNDENANIMKNDLYLNRSARTNSASSLKFKNFLDHG